MKEEVHQVRIAQHGRSPRDCSIQQQKTAKAYLKMRRDWMMSLVGRAILIHYPSYCV